MTDKTKILAIRVPISIANELKDYNMRKLIENIAELVRLGVIKIVDNEIVMPEEQFELNMDKFYEVCHERNIDPQTALNKCVQMLWR